MSAMATPPTTRPRVTDPATLDDVDCAALLVFDFLNEIGFRTGDLEAAGFKPVVAPLRAGLNLRVASPERLEQERAVVAQVDALEGDHLARVRHHLRQLNGAGDDEESLPW